MSRTFQPTDEQRKNVKILAALGVLQAAICAIIRDYRDRPISESTFRKHFRKEIETGTTELNAKVGSLMVGDNPRHRSAKWRQADHGREDPRQYRRRPQYPAPRDRGCDRGGQGRTNRSLIRKNAT